MQVNCSVPLFLQLKTQLNETLTKLRTEQSERQKVAGDLHKVRLLVLQMPFLHAVLCLESSADTLLILDLFFLIINLFINLIC